MIDISKYSCSSSEVAGVLGQDNKCQSWKFYILHVCTLRVINFTQRITKWIQNTNPFTAYLTHFTYLHQVYKQDNKGLGDKMGEHTWRVGVFECFIFIFEAKTVMKSPVKCQVCPTLDLGQATCWDKRQSWTEVPNHCVPGHLRPGLDFSEKRQNIPRPHSPTCTGARCPPGACRCCSPRRR